MYDRSMIHTQEEQTNRETNFRSQSLDDAWKKYNKRMDDLIDDAEIEAELEA